MLVRDGHASAPSLADAAVESNTIPDERYLPRSREIEDIPEVLLAPDANGSFPRSEPPSFMLVFADLFALVFLSIYIIVISETSFVVEYKDR